MEPWGGQGDALWAWSLLPALLSPAPVQSLPSGTRSPLRETLPCQKAENGSVP